jgi:hypothetical protein
MEGGATACLHNPGRGLCMGQGRKMKSEKEKEAELILVHMIAPLLEKFGRETVAKILKRLAANLLGEKQ